MTQWARPSRFAPSTNAQGETQNEGLTLNLSEDEVQITLQ